MNQNNDFKVGDRVIYAGRMPGTVTTLAEAMEAGHVWATRSRTHTAVRLDDSGVVWIPVNQLRYADDLAKLILYGKNNTPIKVKNCYCPDGVRRVARLTGVIPSSSFEMPAQIKVNGKTVTGYVTKRERPDSKEDYEFIAYQYCKNHTALTPEMCDVYPNLF